MAEREEIVLVSVDDKGAVEIKVKGVPGSSCLEVTKDIEEALGEVTNRQRTAEFNEKPATTSARHKRTTDH